MTRAWAWSKRALWGLVMGLSLLALAGVMLWLTWWEDRPPTDWSDYSGPWGHP